MTKLSKTECTFKFSGVVAGERVNLPGLLAALHEAGYQVDVLSPERMLPGDGETHFYAEFRRNFTVADAIRAVFAELESITGRPEFLAGCEEVGPLTADDPKHFFLLGHELTQAADGSYTITRGGETVGTQPTLELARAWLIEEPAGTATARRHQS